MSLWIKSCTEYSNVHNQIMRLFCINSLSFRDGCGKIKKKTFLPDRFCGHIISLGSEKRRLEHTLPMFFIQTCVDLNVATRR